MVKVNRLERTTIIIRVNLNKAQCYHSLFGRMGGSEKSRCFVLVSKLLKGDEHWTVPAFSQKSVLYRFNSVYMFTFVFDFQISLGMYVKGICYLYSFSNMFYILIRSACITYFMHAI